MEFSLKQSIEVLERTPLILEQFLGNLSQDWLHHNEDDHTWSPYDVVGHLIFGEKTDWLVRIHIILNDSESKMFEPFDRFAQMNDDPNTSINELLTEFKSLRKRNLDELNALKIKETDFSRIGIHPELGKVTLKEIISCWVVHDLGHIAQISRVMAKQYKEDVGPWIEYLNILKR